MPYQLGLPAALARFGLVVETVPGWETRGNASFNPKGSVNHHTAGPASGIRPSLHVVTYGRSDLTGPLCNVFLDRNGVAVVVAAGRANHAGQGGYRGLIGNSAVFGTEAESTGIGANPWTDKQLEAYPKVVAAYHYLMGQNNADTNCNHKTWAPYRKVDCASLTDDWFRAKANELLLTGGDDMYSQGDRDRDERVHNQLLTKWPQLGDKTPVDALAEILATVKETNALIKRELTTALPNRVDGKTKDTLFGMALNADANSYKALVKVQEVLDKITKTSL
jgi:hypothetical protein